MQITLSRVLDKLSNCKASAAVLCSSCCNHLSVQCKTAARMTDFCTIRELPFLDTNADVCALFLAPTPNHVPSSPHIQD